MKNNFDEIWERIKSETNLSSFKELGEIIGRSGPAISGAKAKNEFPPGWAYQVGKKFGLLTEWIMTGEEPKKRGERKKNQRKFEILDQAEEWLTKQVDEDPEREAWFNVEFKKAFPEWKKWKEEKEESAAEEAYSSSRKVA